VSQDNVTRLRKTDFQLGKRCTGNLCGSIMVDMEIIDLRCCNEREPVACEFSAPRMICSVISIFHIGQCSNPEEIGY